MKRIALLALLIGLAVSLSGAEDRGITQARVSIEKGVSIHYLQSGPTAALARHGFFDFFNLSMQIPGPGGRPASVFLSKFSSADSLPGY